MSRLLTAVHTDPSGAIKHANERFCQISKYSRDELVGHTHRVVKSGTHSRAFWADMWRDIAKGRKLMGFKPIPSERLSKVSTDRFVCAWAKSGVALGVGAEIQTRLTERADKSYAMQPYARMSIGAVRVEEAKVVEIACVE